MYLVKIRRHFSSMPRETKLDPAFIFEIRAQIIKGEGIQGRFPGEEQEKILTIRQALD
jgi:hypothetical protein